MAAAASPALCLPPSPSLLSSPLHHPHSSTHSHNLSSRLNLFLAPCWISAAFSSHRIARKANSSLNDDVAAKSGESVGEEGGAHGRPVAQESWRVRRPAETTDWIASALSRRFGLGAGLAWLGFLAFGVISEQLKTRFELMSAQQGTRDVENAVESILPNKVSFADLRVGGGSLPKLGDLVVVDLIGKVQKTGQVFVDTTSESRRPLVFLYGARPYARGMCEGLEFALQSMKVGGKRKVIVPPSLGFGESGADFGEGHNVPAGTTLEYILELKIVSLSP